MQTAHAHQYVTLRYERSRKRQKDANQTNEHTLIFSTIVQPTYLLHLSMSTFLPKRPALPKQRPVDNNSLYRTIG